MMNKELALTDPQLAFWYANDIVKGPWKEAEDIISTCAFESWRYAKFVIKGRFTIGESTIKKNPIMKTTYENHFNIELKTAA